MGLFPVSESEAPKRVPRRDPTPTARRQTGSVRPPAPPERLSLGSRVAGRVGLAALFWGALAGGLVAAVLWANGVTDPRALFGVLAASLASGIAAFVVVHQVFARRLSRVAQLIEQRAQERSGAALTVEGDEELDQVALAINRLLRSVSIDRPEAKLSSADSTQRELVLSDDLAKITKELEQRLRERALLFDVLRESASSQNLDSVLETLSSRLGPAMRFREVAVLLKEDDASFRIRAAWGFATPSAVIGRTIVPGQGLTGEAARSGRPVLVTDVGAAPDYLAFTSTAPARAGCRAAT